jgi:LacI family transcriptional regulator, gluconate utilization system Gnt-I transcriptional repressor
MPARPSRNRDNRRSRLTGKQAKMVDVAALAGVSIITVSRALRGSDVVAPRTRERIETAIAELGYVPNLLAGGLARTETRIVAAIVPYVEHGVFADALHGLSDRMAAAGYCVLLGSSGGSMDNEESIVRTLLGHRPAGIVLQGADHTNATRRMLSAARIPVVEMGTLVERPIDLCVGYSNAKAAETMTEHLIRRGRKRIALVIGNPDTNDRAAERLRGYQMALANSGLRFDPKLVVHQRFDIDQGRYALDAMLKQVPRMDAMFCSSDSWAAGAIFECERRSIDVPARLAVAGFNDQDIAAQIVPALTTIRVPRYEIGSKAGELILARIAKTPVQPIVDLGFQLIVRESA